jgi:hypothetical protein
MAVWCRITCCDARLPFSPTTACALLLLRRIAPFTLELRGPLSAENGRDRPVRRRRWDPRGVEPSAALMMGPEAIREGGAAEGRPAGLGRQARVVLRAAAMATSRIPLSSLRQHEN